MILWANDPYGSKFSLLNKIQQELVPKGMKLISIDVRNTETAKMGKWVKIRPGTDCALALGMMHVAIKEELYDKKFVDEYVYGFDKLVEHVKQYPPAEVSQITGVPAEEIVEITRTFFENQPGCIVQGTGGLDRQSNNMQNTRAIAMLQALTGSINVPGGWIAFPPYGLPDLRLPDFKGKAIGVEKYPLFFARGIYGDFAPYGPEAEIIKAMLTDDPYPIKAFISTCGNPMVMIPDPAKFKKALNRMDLSICVELFMSETAKESDYVLPSTTWMEETGIGSLPVGWTHGGINMCSYRHQIVEPIGEAWPNWKIWSELGRRLGHGEHFPWNSNEEVTAMMLSETGIPLEDLKNTPGQIRLEVEYGHHRYEGFPSQSGKVEFFSHAFEAAGQPPLPVHREPTQSPVSSPELAEKYPMILVSGIRVREYIHSALRHMDRLKAMRPEPEAEIHPDAAKKYGIENGKNVEVATKSGAVIMKARVTEDIHSDVVAIPHGWAKANANALIDDEDREPTAGYPQDKGLLCSIRQVD